MEGLAQAMQVVGNIKNCYLNKCPNGKYSFVGHVDTKLCYQKETYFGTQWMAMVFDTKEQAIEFAKNQNVEIVH